MRGALGIVTSLFVGLGWSGIGWAVEESEGTAGPHVTKGGPGDINQDKAEVRKDRLELDKDVKEALVDRDTAQKDWARYQQDKQQVDKQVAALEAQRAAALKAGKTAEAERIAKQIRADRRRLRAEYDAAAKAAKGYLVEKEAARKDWIEYKQDQRDLFKDEGRTRTAGGPAQASQNRSVQSYEHLQSVQPPAPLLRAAQERPGAGGPARAEKRR